VIVSFTEAFPIQMLTGGQWLALLPLIVMSLTAVGALLLSPWFRALSLGLFMAGSILTLMVVSISDYQTAQSILGGTIVVDRLSQVFWFLIVAAGLAASLMSLGFDRREKILAEYYALIAFAVVGMMVLVSTQNLVFLFIALELMSLAVYVLVSIRRQSSLAAEAGLKYFLLGGAASAVLLYGMSILYGTTGSLTYLGIRETYLKLWQPDLPILAAVGLGLVGFGFLFKVGAVPFHVWIPDVYTGASTPVSGFMISAVKAAAIGALLRFSTDVFATPGIFHVDGAFYVLLSAIIALTLIIGSLVGLRQTNLKRLLAYSTIAHTGYLLLGFLALIVGQKAEAAEAIASYTIFYAVMNLGSFAVLTLMSPEGDDQLELKDLTGLGRQRPFVAFSLAVFLMSMAGIPPTAGFFGKYYLFLSAVSAGEITLTVLAVLASVVSAVFYLKPIYFMYMKEEAADLGPAGMRWAGGTAVIGLALILTLIMGLLPAWFTGLI
jgi:NADH-quinone oxidoreductase subunit N